MFPAQTARGKLTPGGQTVGRNEAPSAKGLYDPRHEHDSCGVGFIVHLKGQKSHQLVEDGITALEHLNHRGACGCEVNTGDGAGVLIQVPHEFFMHECASLGIRLPGRGHYGAGLFFASRDERARTQAMALFAAIVEEEGQHLLGWRPVPPNTASVGNPALAAEPAMFQVFIGRGQTIPDDDAFERRLYVIRKRFERAIHRFGIPDSETFYFPSLSSRTLVYKGMLMATQLREYFPDLSDPRLISALCMYHSRFSTNTFPSWRLAHPYRLISHNGEINTLRGNINWMRAREALLESPLFDDIQRVLPIIDEKGSDTACFDNALELLVLAGRPLPHAMVMLIPEAWDGHESMSAEKKAFYEYHSCLMEPWDGPASIVFTDGKTIGATLDRNGLRPSRYYVTKDDLVIMASEVGVLPVEPDRVLYKGRLQPGKTFFISLEEGRIVDDSELKAKLATEHPYGEWLEKNTRSFARLPDAGPPPPPPLGRGAAPLQLLQAAVRAGDEPAAGRHPRGVGHVRQDAHRPGGQPPGPSAGELPHDQRGDAVPGQPADDEAEGAEGPVSAADSPAHPLPGQRRPNGA